jgi:hypothetical protein
MLGKKALQFGNVLNHHELIFLAIVVCSSNFQKLEGLWKMESTQPSSSF